MKKIMLWLFLVSLFSRTQIVAYVPAPYLYFGIADNFIATLPRVYNITTVLKADEVISPIQPLVGLGIKVPGFHKVQNGYLGAELLFNNTLPVEQQDKPASNLGLLSFGLSKNYFLHYYNFSLGASFKIGVMNKQYLYNTYSPKHAMDKLQDALTAAQKLAHYVAQNGIPKTLSKLELLDYDRDQKRNYEDFLRKIYETGVFSLAINIFVRPFQNFDPLRHFCFEIECGPVFILPQTAGLRSKLWQNWQSLTTVVKSISIINCCVNIKVYLFEV